MYYVCIMYVFDTKKPSDIEKLYVCICITCIYECNINMHVFTTKDLISLQPLY